MTLQTDEQVILVDENDLGIGAAEKHDVHRRGLLHRAFSIFLFDETGRTLLQRRAAAKYHSGGKWANTCCGHPRPGEAIAVAAARRLGEELGLSAPLSPLFRTRYQVALDNGMAENELVHVFAGRLDARSMRLNPDEVEAVTLMSIPDMAADIASFPQSYAYWLRFYVQHHQDRLHPAAA
ncbi:isopentenyl-diphosphate Delta-isomerase [Xanthobacteraceae bacterium A53D]